MGDGRWEMGDGRLGDWEGVLRVSTVGEIGRLGGSVAGKYCSGGGFGLGWFGLVWFGGFSKEGERRVQKESV